MYNNVECSYSVCKDSCISEERKQGCMAGLRDSGKGMSTPGMSGGEQCPYPENSIKQFEWILGFRETVFGQTNKFTC